MFRDASTFRGHIVIVGASLAGLSAARTLHQEGFQGQVTVIGDEHYPPYDRPPLSKSVLSGWLPADNIFLPRDDVKNVEWLLGVAATHLHLDTKTVELADGRQIAFDRLLIATGTRARPWPNESEAALDGVFTIRTLDDSKKLRERLAAKPRHVLVIGAGFTGSEVASICREQDISVTVTERSAAPLAGALGGAAGIVFSHLQRAHGVDLRCNVTVMSLEGDAQGHVRTARLSDGDDIPVDIVVVALGSVRNIEWLRGADLAADERGVACDGACRVLNADAIVTDNLFVAGDIARWPNAIFDGQFLVVEHWGNAVEQAATAAHNMICAPKDLRGYRHVPNFWSNQFGLNIKAVGLPTLADEVMVVQGTVTEARFVAVYGAKGRMVAALAVNMPRDLDYYETLIRQKSPFPPHLEAPDKSPSSHIIPAGFPAHAQPTHSQVAFTTGPGPHTPTNEMQMIDPRVPQDATPLT